MRLGQVLFTFRSPMAFSHLSPYKSQVDASYLVASLTLQIPALCLKGPVTAFFLAAPMRRIERL